MNFEICTKFLSRLTISQSRFVFRFRFQHNNSVCTTKYVTSRASVEFYFYVCVPFPLLILITVSPFPVFPPEIPVVSAQRDRVQISQKSFPIPNCHSFVIDLFGSMWPWFGVKPTPKHVLYPDLYLPSLRVGFGQIILIRVLLLIFSLWFMHAHFYVYSH